MGAEQNLYLDGEIVGKDQLHPDSYRDGKNRRVELLPYSCWDRPGHELEFKDAEENLRLGGYYLSNK